MIEPAPINELGLVTFPSNRECIGDGCRYRDTPRGCFKTRHHRYHHENRYCSEGTDSPYYLLRTDSFSVLTIAACVHDIQHRRPSIRRPPKDVVVQRLGETGTLRRQMGAAICIACHLFETETGLLSPLELSHQPKKEIERQHEESLEVVAGTRAVIATFETIEPEILKNPFADQYTAFPETIREHAAQLLAAA